MPQHGWKQLLAGAPWFRAPGLYPIEAYSEFMPPPRFALKAYGTRDFMELVSDDPFGWPITEYEEAFYLRPGLRQVAGQILLSLVHLGEGKPSHGISPFKLANNPCWPPELARRAGKLPHERYVNLLPLALSRTLDDKGRVNWSVFGGSEQGPARAFWKSFYTAPGKEVPAEHALAFIRRLLHDVYQEPHVRLINLEEAGFRILPQDGDKLLPLWLDEALPSWTEPFLLRKDAGVDGVRFLLTFQPFNRLPAAVKVAYLSGRLHLLPFPGSLIFWGVRPYIELHKKLPFALQIPLQHSLARHAGPTGMRVPQSGWLHEPSPSSPDPGHHHGPMRNAYRRTHRWARVHRDEDELSLDGRDDKLLHVLFSTSLEDLGLYGKPMARNAQIWTHDCHLLLDGPRADAGEIRRVAHLMHQGGLFGYRMMFPAMRVGTHEVYWHRPLVAYRAPGTDEPIVIPDGPAGYLTAYDADHPDLARPVELWPRFLQREPHLEAIQLFEHATEPRPKQTSLNVRKLLEASNLARPRPLPAGFARQLLTLPKHEPLEAWLDGLAERATDPERARRLAHHLRDRLEPTLPRIRRNLSAAPLTYGRTARRSFEVAYWNAIAFLAHGRYRNKNNADCVLDEQTHDALCHQHRDLEELGDYLLHYYARKVEAAGMAGKALVGELPFVWRTNFDFSYFGGWSRNQEGKTNERDLIVVIPGRDRSRAVIMGDHYDTAYMEDHYEHGKRDKGARLAAAGADDNHSATAALMLAAPIFLELSRKKKLACDIWLIHLTGEEFPADCLGARHLSQWLVEGTLKMRRTDGKEQDLSRTTVQGVYVMDMIAHNNDHDRDVFQIAPGTSRESLWLAQQAHLANAAWNGGTEVWNRRPTRRECGRSKRVRGGAKVPATAQHLALNGEVRLPYDPRSTLYNTDGQIFSDAGIPVVLFMENYDINRTGYHDSHDNMTNIDLDYGAALAAIAIESVARAATVKPERGAL
jgi:hypothetical protein